ncbi:MAG: hypothetical protein ABSH06_23325 [Thermodesulfobacteriota bacterium]
MPRITVVDTLVAGGTQVVIITATARAIIAVGTADGAMATIPVAIGSIVIRVGGGPIPIIYLHRRSPNSLRCIADRRSSNPITGTTARIHKVITRTSKAARAVG